MSDFSHEMERRLHAFGKDVQSLVRKLTDPIDDEGFSPRVDICEDDQSFLIYADLPGMSKDQIKLTVNDGVLFVKGERQTFSANDSTLIRQERPHGAFSRSVRLPEDVDIKDVKASFRKGVLEITFPKKVGGDGENSIEID